MTLMQRDREKYEEGLKEGLKEGREVGLREMAALAKILYSKNREADFMRTLDDVNYRDEQLKEYNLG